MSAPHKLPRFQAANDERKRKNPRTIAIVMLAHDRKSLLRLIAGAVLLLGLGLMATAIWSARKETAPAKVTAASAPKPTEAAKLTDIVLPASGLSPDKTTPEDQGINIVANKMGDLPALAGNGWVQASPTNEEDSRTLLARAYGLLESNNYEEALALYERVLATDERTHDALAGKTYALAATGKYADAAEAGRRFLKLYPHDDVAEANLAQILMKTGKNDEAIAYLDRAARDRPDRLSYRLDLAALYDRTGYRDAALMLYRQLIDASDRDDEIALPLTAIRERASYLESLDTAAASEPSTTLPVDN